MGYGGGREGKNIGRKMGMRRRKKIGEEMKGGRGVGCGKGSCKEDRRKVGEENRE